MPRVLPGEQPSAVATEASREPALLALDEVHRDQQKAGPERAGVHDLPCAPCAVWLIFIHTADTASTDQDAIDALVPDLHNPLLAISEQIQTLAQRVREGLTLSHTNAWHLGLAQARAGLEQ